MHPSNEPNIDRRHLQYNTMPGLDAKSPWNESGSVPLTAFFLWVDNAYRLSIIPKPPTATKMPPTNRNPARSLKFSRADSGS